MGSGEEIPNQLAKPEPSYPHCNVLFSMANGVPPWPAASMVTGAQAIYRIRWDQFTSFFNKTAPTMNLGSWFGGRELLTRIIRIGTQLHLPGEEGAEIEQLHGLGHVAYAAIGHVGYQHDVAEAGADVIGADVEVVFVRGGIGGVGSEVVFPSSGLAAGEEGIGGCGDGEEEEEEREGEEEEGCGIHDCRERLMDWFGFGIEGGVGGCCGTGKSLADGLLDRGGLMGTVE